ncbi:hypothetical protein [Dyella tabacisoli]|uniref:PNPLA domain-containing protein n=1 Tax=Dyella tabacisoli TaxID=2282381 RepID=A0A369UMV3_9GAMM|nr:hypothetical protein [Dyella tabacisoli]RDD80930.1 hypothetical protein DVJ77_14580 [Dyella tabacisoli]
MRTHHRVAETTELGRLSRAGSWLEQAISSLIDHAKPVRVTLLILAIAVFAAVGADQVSELFLFTVWSDPDADRYLGLLASSALAGLSIWYAARNAYRLSYPRWPALQDPQNAGLRNWLPRLLGAAVPLLVLLGYLMALHGVEHGPCEITVDCRQRSWRAMGLLLESVLLVAFCFLRRRVLNAMFRRAKAAPMCVQPSEELRVASVLDLGRFPLRLYASTIVLNIAATVLIVWWPELLDGIGPLAILLIAASFLCLSGGFVCMLADRRGLPVLSSLLLLSLLLHTLRLNDNHRVRQYPEMSTHQLPATVGAETRPSFDDYAKAWLDDRCAGRATCPVVLVSSEGGGIRGAAWTAMVLGRLTDAISERQPNKADEPLLGRYMFAGSGVSGGSLGLASYVALLHQSNPPGNAPLEARAQSLLKHDFLAPTLANMFFVDFTQRWLPGAWFDDRSRALTRAWEKAAEKHGVDAFAQPFAALYRGSDGQLDTRMPALFLNSTTVAEGRRFIQHPFRPIAMSITPAPTQPIWTAAFDGSAWLDPRVPLSEVVLNSARFTYLSPAGTLNTAATPSPSPSHLQLVDGGYFENSGTTTLLEVMQQLRAIAMQRGQTLRFIVLHISNDPDIADFVTQHDPAQVVPLYSTACPAVLNGTQRASSGELTAPLKALLDTRSARGEYARVQLLQALQPDDMLWHFRLCHGDYPVPLGWTISTPVFTELQRQLQQHYPVAAMAQTLEEQLAPR